MSEPVNELVHMAEADGATFQKSPLGAWGAKDRDGIIVVRGALSKVEAAILYIEDRDLVADTPEAILARIKHEYRPYDTLPEFQEGFDDHQARRRHEKYDGVKAQAYDRGASTAMLYARALAFLENPPSKPDAVSPGWLQRLLTGRL